MTDQNTAAISETPKPLDVKQAGQQIKSLGEPKQEVSEKPETPESEGNQSEKDQDKATKPEENLKPEAETSNNDDQDENLEENIDDDAENQEEDQDSESEDDEDLEGDEDLDAEYGEDEGDDEVDEGDLIEIPNKDGSVEKVTAEELIAGYMRNKDYTQKSQDNARVAKENEAIREEISDLPQVRKTYADTAKQLGDTAQLVLTVLDSKFIPQEPTADLMEENPSEYVRQKEARQEALQFKGAIVQAIQKQQATDKALFEKELATNTVALHREYPVLKKEVEQKAVREYIKTSTDGRITDEDIDKNANHSLFIYAHKAMKWDALVEKRKTLKAKSPKPKVMKSSKARENPASIKQRKRTDAKNQHKKTGSIKSAASVLAERYKKK